MAADDFGGRTMYNEVGPAPISQLTRDLIIIKMAVMVDDQYYKYALI
jgi:hypothetical protein